MAEKWYSPKDQDKKEMNDWIVSRSGKNIIMVVVILTVISLAYNFISGLF